MTPAAMAAGFHPGLLELDPAVAACCFLNVLGRAAKKLFNQDLCSRLADGLSVFIGALTLGNAVIFSESCG
jgi:hypothetical protein